MMKKTNSGQIRIIEAFLSALIIFSSIITCASLTVTEDLTNHNDLVSAGLQSLVKLDSDGSLSRYIDNGNWTDLRDALNLLLPTSTSFNLTVYDKHMNQINTEIISNGGFSSQEIFFIEYICASQGSTFNCYIIHLNLSVAS